jgi:hypothetical protein
MDRRGFLRLAGGGAVLAAMTGCASSGPDPAAAWAEAGEAVDPRRFVLSHALLAPNPHNRQPWLARLDGPDAITLFVDRTRLLPVTDAYSRQIVVGCGAFLELLVIAATARGLRAETRPWPDGEAVHKLDQRPFARVQLVESDLERDVLYPHILARRSNKEAYDPDRTVGPAALASMTAAAVGPGLRTAFSTDPVEVARLRALVTRAYVREVETPAAMKESVDLMRIGRREVAKHRDGIDLTGAPIEAMAAVGLLTREKMMTPGSMAFEQGKGLYAPLAESTNAFAWLVSEGNSRNAQLAAGRAYARMNLQATAQGLAIHPMSQALQEFAEMAPLKAEVEQLTSTGAGERLQMLVRVGYGRAVPPSPRRGLSEHLIA